VFPVEVDPAVVASDYIAGGAAAISVLTDAPFFQGSLEDMEQAAMVAHAAGRPVAILRKDFLVDPYQVVEAWAYGADAVLLIVAALSDDQLREMMAVVDDYGLEALVEVHDEAEMTRAIALGARNLGINNRDLHTFKVDLATTERLAPLAPEGAVVIGESGVFGPAEIERLWNAGARAVLVGEGVIVQPDRAGAVRSLREGVTV
jgi:indole-3-glycerol phosphate synthase